MTKTGEERRLRGDQPAAVEDIYKAVETAFKKNEEAKDSHFKKIFKSGWRRIQTLADKSPKALKLWAFLAEYAGPNGAILVSQDDLAEHVGCTTRTIRTLVRLLEKEGALITIREAGGCIYALNCDEVWALAADQRDWSPFKTNALFSKNARGVLTKRLAVAKFQPVRGRTHSRGREDGQGAA